jgi:hypothetical protein
MAVAPQVGTAVDTSKMPWVPMQPKDGSPPRSFAKILHLDERRNFVIMLNRTVKGTVLPSHTHLCEAIGYTLRGRWAYRDIDLGPESFGVEPTGTEHAPEYTEDTEALIIFLGDSPDLLKTHLPDGRTITTTMDTFLELRRKQEEMIAAAD